MQTKTIAAPPTEIPLIQVDTALKSLRSPTSIFQVHTL